MEIYFTPEGIIYTHNELISQDENSVGDERGKRVIQSTSFKFYWIGASPDARIVGIDQVPNYFTYGYLNDSSGKSAIRANAFRKIVYKDIYPKIDIEYIFPEGKVGLKYNVILHPGADAGLVQMEYDSTVKVNVDSDGNVSIESPFGEFIDHAPETYYENGGAIKSSFVVSNNRVSFQIEGFDKNKIVVIDPWITVPVFSTAPYHINSAYDVDWDYQGNVYIYGGYYPFMLSKLNSSGAIQWTYINLPFNSLGGAYGDFAIDRNCGMAYICRGYNLPGSRLLKVNTLGSQVALSPVNPDSVNEYWRIAFNSCTGKGVIAAGGTTVFRQACTFDSALNVTSFNVLGANKAFFDMSLLALDDTNAYMATARSAVTFNPALDNVLVKCQLPSMLPIAYMVKDGYSFFEVTTPYVYGTNGFNGMAKSKCYLYTYDGAKLKKWNPGDGALLDSVAVNTIKDGAAGIAVDACDNIFIGTLNGGVREYDSTLTFIASDNSVDSVYDVTVGVGGQVFACGANFVAALSLSACPSSLNVTASSTPSLCPNNNGTATALVNGGVLPYTYYWSPGGQTTSAVTGLAPGTYHVSVFENNGMSCVTKAPQTVSVIVGESFTLTWSAILTGECAGNLNGTADVAVSGGTPSYFYNWSNGQSTQTATGLSAGTYSVVVTDINGCKDSMNLTIKALPNPVANVSNNITIFQGQSTTLTANGGSAYLWNIGETAATLIVAPEITTIYCVVVMDTNNCKDTACLTVDVKSPCDTAGTFYFPNAFSPNGDGENDSLQIYYRNMNCIESFPLAWICFLKRKIKLEWLVGICNPDRRMCGFVIRKSVIYLPDGISL